MFRILFTHGLINHQGQYKYRTKAVASDQITPEDTPFNTDDKCNSYIDYYEGSTGDPKKHIMQVSEKSVTITLNLLPIVVRRSYLARFM